MAPGSGLPGFRCRRAVPRRVPVTGALRNCVECDRLFKEYEERLRMRRRARVRPVTIGLFIFLRPGRWSRRCTREGHD